MLSSLALEDVSSILELVLTGSVADIIEPRLDFFPAN